MANILNHIFVSAKADGSDATQVQASNWNAGHILSGGNHGSILLRDTTDATYGASWLQSVAVGQVVVSNGVAALPSWSAAPMLTSVTVTSFFGGSGTIATTGVGRFASATGLYWRNAANTANIIGLLLDASDNVLVGGTNGTSLVPGAGDDQQDLGTGSTRWRNAGFTRVVTIGGAFALGTTSTDAIVAQNTTAATAGVPVQMSPRFRFRSNVWNTTAVAANNTDDFFIESVPSSGAVPAGLLKFGSSLNGAAATYPATLDSTGQLVLIGGTAPGVAGSLALPIAGRIYWVGRAQILTSAAGQLLFYNQDGSTGVGFNFVNDAVLQVRTRAQTGYATVDALAYQVSGVAGIDTTVTTGSLVGKTMTFSKGLLTSFA